MNGPMLQWSGRDSRGTVFRVVREGCVRGRWLSVGALVICRGAARSGDDVVLVARGIGRPRLGWQEGTALLGSSGERCHPARWSSAGRVVAVEYPEVSPMPLDDEAPANTAGQLALFAA